MPSKKPLFSSGNGNYMHNKACKTYSGKGACPIPWVVPLYTHNPQILGLGKDSDEIQWLTHRSVHTSDFHLQCLFAIIPTSNPKVILFLEKNSTRKFLNALLRFFLFYFSFAHEISSLNFQVPLLENQTNHSFIQSKIVVLVCVMQNAFGHVWVDSS